MPPSTRQSQTTRGIALMCAGVACLSINDALAKTLTADYSVLQILFVRNLIALPLAILIACKFGGRKALLSKRPGAHLVRGIIWLSAAVCFFTSLRFLGLAEATTLIFAAPVFVTALSAVFLKESVGWRRWLLVLVGFAGVMIVVRPGAATFQPASLLPVGAAIFYALLMIGARWVDPRESVWTLMLYLVGTGALLSGLAMPFVWQTPHFDDLWMFVAISLFGTTGMTLMTEAFRFAPASVVSPFDYSALLWATLLGWLIWNDIPDVATYIGAFIIILSGIAIVLRERRLESQHSIAVPG